MQVKEPTDRRLQDPKTINGLTDNPFGYPRDFLNNRFVYIVISPRAKGLSVGVNFNPDKACNFDCIYCEVTRNGESRVALDIEAMAGELFHTLQMAYGGGLRLISRYEQLPDELLQVRHVALSGDGEPTLSPHFTEAVQSVMHVRALGHLPFFRIVLITNGTGLDLPEVQYGLKFFTKSDEIWIKLDAGTQSHLERISRSQVSLQKILDNILLVAKHRPVIIQSLFPLYKGQEPSAAEIEAYAHRLLELKDRGAIIPLVQIYSATRPAPNSDYGHLPLRTLSRIAQRVREVAGIKAEVF
jgi:wyosine [tRNA(Phe)-imidazoG37] synthetase (radical SAM superfamily)